MRYISLLIILFSTSFVFADNEDLITSNRVRAFKEASWFSTSPNPYVFYKLIDNSGKTAIIVVQASFVADSFLFDFINKQNIYDSEILIDSLDRYSERLRYYTIDVQKMEQSSYFHLTDTQILSTYFNENGLIKDYTFVDEIEFLYFLLLRGFYIYHGCEASSELYIE